MVNDQRHAAHRQERIAPPPAQRAAPASPGENGVRDERDAGPGRTADAAPGRQDTEQELSFVSPQGELHRVLARFGPDRPRVVRPPAVARPVRFKDGWKGVQVRLPEEAAGDRAAYTLLEAEITAALALHRAFGGTRFAGLFPTPVGHDMNTPSPFVLYAVPRGRPLAGLTEGVSLAGQRVVERDLVLAVRLMDLIGLVHRGIVPGAVRWDDHAVQVWDLGSVVRTGRPRVPYGVPPFASPEQRAGVGATEPRDALWSVAQVMHQLVTGRPGSPDGPPADLAAHRSLAGTLSPVYARRAEDRPTPDALLRTLVPEMAAEVAGVLLPDPLEQYRREFDETRRRKHAALALRPHARAVAPPPEDDGPATGHGHDYGGGQAPAPYPTAPPPHPTAAPGDFTGYEYEPRPDRSRLRTWISGGRTSGTTGPDRGRSTGGNHR
ncbi:hypothetical protein [Streptomyces sp. NBC_00582]|uniref:hypothetical protein n=1 Tax=Streptomyces sp. NBC_00582 TaxID=2975783 RepID=UPI0010F0F883|nr:hypothetical protein [Streptomyces sp. NBC_00582]WUB60491.1 hypothetical protein OG852_08865 [Streptomyces sp. NBC_00582]